MTEPQNPEVVLRQLINGYQVSQAISAAASLGIADCLAASARSSTEIAAELKVDLDALTRLLRALTGIGLLSENEIGSFQLTELGALLRTDTPKSLAGWAEFIGSPVHWQAWGSLLHNVQTGENAFTHVHGVDPWTYRQAHPEASEQFDRGMTSLSSILAKNVTEEFDFSQFGTIVDVGGGNGRFLGAILAANPGSRGVVFDLPHVVSGAATVLASLGVGNRCSTVGGSFFESVPAGGDAYILKSTLHDWEDSECRTILGVCRKSMAAGTSVLIVERELGGPKEKWEARFSDLNMLVGPGGRERTIDEYKTLLADSGFRPADGTSCSSGQVVVRGIAA